VCSVSSPVCCKFLWPPREHECSAPQPRRGTASAARADLCGRTPQAFLRKVGPLCGPSRRPWAAERSRCIPPRKRTGGSSDGDARWPRTGTGRASGGRREGGGLFVRARVTDLRTCEKYRLSQILGGDRQQPTTRLNSRWTTVHKAAGGLEHPVRSDTCARERIRAVDVGNRRTGRRCPAICLDVPRRPPYLQCLTLRRPAPARKSSADSDHRVPRSLPHWRE